MATYHDPFHDFDRFFNAAFRPTATGLGMPMDLYKDGDSFIATIDLPGVDPATIDINVEDRTLTVSAERKGVEGEGLQWLNHERPSGTFARQLTLGYGVALDQISADYSGGVLTLTIPVAEENKSRKISVNVGNDHNVIEG
ncbi:MAG: Hsp20/alpha crystallin family protein [Varibaculum sp.]|nr:Hsp20/alpha crystallin family protein [Varibaculum sp.]